MVEFSLDPCSIRVSSVAKSSSNSFSATDETQIKSNRNQLQWPPLSLSLILTPPLPLFLLPVPLAPPPSPISPPASIPPTHLHPPLLLSFLPFSLPSSTPLLLFLPLPLTPPLLLSPLLLSLPLPLPCTPSPPPLPLPFLSLLSPFSPLPSLSPLLSPPYASPLPPSAPVSPSFPPSPASPPNHLAVGELGPMIGGPFVVTP